MKSARFALLCLVAALVPTLGLAAERADWSKLAGSPVRACQGDAIALPGSDTCLRVSGSVRAETSAVIAPRHASASPSMALTHTHVQTRLNLDARTPTELGDLRAYVSVRVPGHGTPVTASR